MSEESTPSPQTESSGSCPVRHESASGSLAGWLAGGSTPSVDNNAIDEKKVGCASPPKYASIEEAAKHAQTPQPDQRLFLNTQRQISSIPRDTPEPVSPEVKTNPHHQHNESETHWVYPSEQQMYNAMRRKGWDNVPEESVPLVLQIHNAVNEGTWQKILKWEGSDDVKLVRFEGRPRDLSPLAFFYSKILHYYPAPFDRHDWFVGPSNGTDNTPPTRYVIDYYMFDNQQDPNAPPKTFIDVRPALDSPRGFYMRGQRFLQSCFPGITARWKRFQDAEK